MPLVKRCCICGRIANNPRSAYPYKKSGFACEQCYASHVVPSAKWKGSKYNKYERLTNKIKQEVIEMWLSGKYFNVEIAAVVGISLSSVKKIIKEYYDANKKETNQL